MIFRVIVTTRAGREIRSSFVWLSNERGWDYAQKWYIRIWAAIESLSTDALTWPEAAEAEWYGPGLREKLVGRKRQTYRVLFQIHKDTVYVHTVRHISQDYLTSDDL